MTTGNNMSNYETETDKLKTQLESLITKHRDLDTFIKETYNNQNITPDVYRLKTQKLWLKDEIHRIEAQLKGS